MRWALAAGLVFLAAAPAEVCAGVVINEVFYHAPDDLDQVQWVELYNPGEESVDLAGWTLDGGEVFDFPPGAVIGAHAYVVIALDREVFARFYKMEALGPLKRPLKRGSERLELRTKAGERVDVARYRDRAPWPVSADGYSASVERVCPTASGELAENWVGSPLPKGAARPAGTPGRRNAGYSATLPPTIDVVGAPPDESAPGEALEVRAVVHGEGGLRGVWLLYQAVSEGEVGEEARLAMDPGGSERVYQARIPGQAADTIVRYRIKVEDEAGAVRLYPAESALRPTFSTYVHGPWPKAPISLAYIINVGSGTKGRGGGRRPGPFFFPFGRRDEDGAEPARGTSALVYVNAASRKAALFDHINIIEREGQRGFKVHLHKDRLLEGMSSVSIVYEGSERSLLAEALAYDVYRRAGMPASSSEFVRVWWNGKMIGYHLLVERPNRGFLRRNHIDPEGNLYKIIWYGQGVVGQHEKKTHVQEGHDDVIGLVKKLESARGETLWGLIQDHFDVDEVATYFAVNMVLSHWDGYHNNYYAYHDTGGTGKWQLFPWDQDKTWGHHDGLPDDEVFFDMPLTFGMAGDRPGQLSIWWRAGGYFARPLLANEGFRRMFLARTREILEQVYTEEHYLPKIDELGHRLREDARLRAELEGGEGEAGVERLERNLASLRTHLRKRRAFLLQQPELKKAETQPAR